MATQHYYTALSAANSKVRIACMLFKYPCVVLY